MPTHLHTRLHANIYVHVHTNTNRRCDNTNNKKTGLTVVTRRRRIAAAAPSKTLPHTVDAVHLYPDKRRVVNDSYTQQQQPSSPPPCAVVFFCIITRNPRVFEGSAMQFLSVVCFVVAAAVVAHAEIKTEEGVLVLNDDNFDEAITASEFVLVEFCEYHIYHTHSLAIRSKRGWMGARQPHRDTSHVPS